MSLPNFNDKQFVQPGLGTTYTKPGGELRSLWIETPGWCDLFCQYCFAGTEKIDDEKNNLSIDEYKKLILEFAQLGGQDIGIPGSGEPFFRSQRDTTDNYRLTFQLLDICKELNISLTIFTTGHWIDALTAQRLLEYDVVLLIKLNSFNEDIQNELVGADPIKNNYARKRDQALLRLMAFGFNQPAYGKKSRLGIVTSVMNANKYELPLLLRFARRHNIIFDCDTILQRGRGVNFEEKGGTPSGEEMLGIFRLLQQIDAEEFENIWDISRSYIGTCCDRFRHHLYISQSGAVHPCVGAKSVELGNIRQKTLLDCWDAPAMKIIRNHKYQGVCAKCLNFIEQKCHSCLGRCTAALSRQQLECDGYVRTVGCWNNRPSMNNAQISDVEKNG